MKWEKDLVKDIRTGTSYDDQDGHNNDEVHPNGQSWPGPEVTEENRAALTERFLRIRDNCQSILEIGVCRNEDDSITHRFLKNKLKETLYFGIDLDDKSFLNDESNNVYTIRNTSSAVRTNLEYMQHMGMKEFGFIFIDGWHSISQVLIDWEYTNFLAPGGIVGFHDTSIHPGPSRFVKALNRDIWVVEENVCPVDHGIGFAWRK